MIETLERPKTSSMKPQTGGWNPWENIRSFWEETLVRTYCLYVRKSSEDDERQALSIESQIEAMRKVAERDKLDVVEIIRESKSAKASGAREGFNTLLEWLRQWRYNSILSWAPDRLSRNAWDLGSVVDLMDQGKLQEIRTNGQIFKNAPNEKFLLMILCSQAKLENDNRSINVIRWLKTKAELGHLPHKAPLGYTNERSYLRNGWKIAIDPERAPYIKLIFEKVAHEVYEWSSGTEISPRRNSLWGLEVGNHWSSLPYTLSSIILCTTVCMNTREEVEIGVRETMSRLLPKNSSMKCKISSISLHDTDHGIRTSNSRRSWSVDFVDLGLRLKRSSRKILGQKDPRSYVYYHCSKCHDHKCKNPMIREDALILQLLEMLDDIDINTISVWDSLKEEIRRYNLFQSQLLKKDSRDVVSAKQINLREYMKYMISNGSKDEKREILGMIQADIILKDKKVSIEKSGSFKVS
jgi:DNA invertase Pin-like site-specific DNA recombinase